MSKLQQTMEEISKWSIIGLTVRLICLWSPPIAYLNIFLPCWDCFDFEATMAHEIRATLAAVAPQRGGTLDACSLHVLGEWSDELVELAPLQSVGEREMNRTASSGRSAGAGVAPPVAQ